MLIQMSQEAIGFYRKMMEEHSDVDSLGVCRCCAMPVRARYREALTALAMAGQEPWDPIADRHLQQAAGEW